MACYNLTLMLVLVGIFGTEKLLLVSGHAINCGVPDSVACATTTCSQANDQHVCPHACGACGFNNIDNGNCFDIWRPGRCRRNLARGRCQFNQRIRNNCQQTCGLCANIPNFPVDNGACFDRWDQFRRQGRCASNIGRCQFDRRVQRNCRRTCGLCFGIPDLQIFPINNGCIDNNPSCRTMVQNNATICLIDNMRNVCRQSCGACQNNPVFNPEPLCRDTSPNCPTGGFRNGRRRARICNRPFGWRRCRLSCGFCSLTNGNDLRSWRNS